MLNVVYCDKFKFKLKVFGLVLIKVKDIIFLMMKLDFYYGEV